MGPRRSSVRPVRSIPLGGVSWRCIWSVYTTGATSHPLPPRPPPVSSSHTSGFRCAGSVPARPVSKARRRVKRGSIGGVLPSSQNRKWLLG
ncbi:hypothetical protein BP00DRAFT_272174 [Aspergillus indologenus CBS 114.80]|uniref:Uncharacterized protein n=1 Tax=Aspergillus indologenus CBS 114.80 TaxID=1450541 RepID=A0A2V5HWG8_9EURO|nr:hypothetical protein BP00DRAFT_272174 [Aspergillus indologenus CBS 114.80]